MKKIFLCTVLSVAIAFGFGVVSASATIFVSGDTNITNPLNDLNGWGGLDAGNQQFFSNILQGGSSVAVLGNSHVGSVGFYDTDVDSYYNSLSGVTSNVFTGTVTSASLSGVDLFVASLPDNAFTGAEISVLSNFLGAGGSLFFLGENSNFATANSYINAALSALGSSMSIQNDHFDAGFQIATGTQIATDPFTAGINTFSYACPSQVLVSGGKALFYGTDNQAFVAYEGASVPEPATMLLFGTGLLGLAGFSRKKFKK